MRPLAAGEIVRVWERAERATALERPVRMLGAVLASPDETALAALPLGRRDALLLELRTATFGDAMRGYAECPSCGERLEIELDARELAAMPSGDGTSETSVDGHSVRVRAVTTADLVAVTAMPRERAHDELLRRCASLDGIPVRIDDATRARLVETIAGCDPLAEILVAMACPACDGESQIALDVGAFFWIEIAAAARRLLHDVDALARAYGWSESEILALAPARRERYLEMIEGRGA